MHRDTGACLQIMDGPEKRADDSFSHKLSDLQSWCKTGFISRHIITIKGGKGAEQIHSFYLHSHSLLCGLNVIRGVNDCLLFQHWASGARCFSSLWFRMPGPTAVHGLHHVPHTIITIFTNCFSSLHFMSPVPHSCAHIATVAWLVFIRPSISTSRILARVRPRVVMRPL